MAKPKANIDWELFEKLVWIPVLSVEQIADMLKVGKRTLEVRAMQKYSLTIGAIRIQKSGPMRRDLFNAMWTSAMNGNVSSQIWLSKNLLGMSDSPAPDETVKEGYDRPESMKPDASAETH